MPVSTDAKLAFLREPASYGSATGPIDVIETHMSWVFLAGELACKLKKPVHTPYLDFSTPEARCHFCREELRLNQRLAPGIYLSVDTLSLDSQGHLQLGGGVEQVDCLVRMRRLPASSMLDQALMHQQASPATMHRIAARIAEFHRQLPPLYPDPLTWRNTLRAEIDRNEAALLAHPQAADQQDARDLCEQQRELLHRRASWFEERISQGRIIEGHGDLRAEHVYLGNDIGAIDCLEFDRHLRTLDTADEIAFLALDCERLHAPALAAELLQAYWQQAHDCPPPALVHFYQALRAGVRARIAALHLDEAPFRQSTKWSQRTRDWLRLARRHQDCISATIDPP